MAIFTLPRASRGAGNRVQSADAAIPAQIVLVKVTMTLQPAAMRSPLTDVEAGIEWSVDQIEWRMAAAATWTGYAGAPTAQMPYIQLGQASLDILRAKGARVRGYIFSRAASDVSVTVEVS